MTQTTHEKKPENVARGLKAAIHNDKVSDEAKANAAQRLEEMGEEVPADFIAPVDSESETDGDGRKHANQQRGYKSVLSNDNTSEEAKEHARAMLDSEPEHDTQTSSSSNDSEHENRMLGGYKATLKNPNVSDEAKEHAEEVLKEHNVY